VGARAASTASTASDPVGDQVDVLLRPAAGQTAAARPGAASAADPRGEVVRIFTKSIAKGGLSDPDRTYLAGIVAQRSGLPQAEAEKRVTDSFTEANRATREAADKARKGGILTGFVTAASLLISLAAAWWAAQQGGHHRDTSLGARLFAPMRRHTSSPAR